MGQPALWWPMCPVPALTSKAAKKRKSGRDINCLFRCCFFQKIISLVLARLTNTQILYTRRLDHQRLSCKKKEWRGKYPDKKENQIFLIYKIFSMYQQLQRHIRLMASSYVEKYLRISSNIRKPFLITFSASYGIGQSYLLHRVKIYYDREREGGCHCRYVRWRSEVGLEPKKVTAKQPGFLIYSFIGCISRILFLLIFLSKNIYELRDLYEG
jgi:hypothetical protein